MKYTVQSSKYVFKNFFYLFPLAILPALFLAVSTDKAAIYGIIRAVVRGEIDSWSFAEIFRAISVLSFASWKSIVFGIVCLIVIVPCVAMLMAMLEKHMRIGKRTFNGLWGKLNDNFLSTFFGVMLLVVLYEIWTLLIAALLFFVSRIAIIEVAYVFAVIIYFVFHLLLIMGISTIYLWLPCMQITGFRALEAWQYSYHLMGEVKAKIIVHQLLALICMEIAVAACAVFIPFYWTFIAVVAGIYAFVFMIFCVRMQVVYFERDHIVRADLAKYYQR